MLLNSKKVKIEGLGTFYTTLECQKGGAVTKEKSAVAMEAKTSTRISVFKYQLL